MASTADKGRTRSYAAKASGHRSTSDSRSPPAGAAQLPTRRARSVAGVSIPAAWRSMMAVTESEVLSAKNTWSYQTSRKTGWSTQLLGCRVATRARKALPSEAVKILTAAATRASRAADRSAGMRRQAARDHASRQAAQGCASNWQDRSIRCSTPGETRRRGGWPGRLAAATCSRAKAVAAVAACAGVGQGTATPGTKQDNSQSRPSASVAIVSPSSVGITSASCVLLSLRTCRTRSWTNVACSRDAAA